MKETIVKINKTKSWFFKKIKLTNLQTDSSRKKSNRHPNFTPKTTGNKRRRTTTNRKLVEGKKS